ncbi:MAG TPA: hypothetical protein VFG78_13090 [Gemmatimonadota bacterium]|nr:hypothetical protein [Gemmatimonadota bacterium]
MARKRSSGKDPLKKTGYQIRLSVAQAVREAVDGGAAESQNAFVERALLRELSEIRRRQVYEAYAEAAGDPAFLEDMGDATGAYEASAGDGLEGRNT